MPSKRWPRAGEAGSAVVDFALISSLVVVLAVGVVQLALAMHVRNVLTDVAGEGARRAALVGGTPAEAVERVHALADAALADGYIDSVAVTRDEVDGVPVVAVAVSAPVPVLGLLGPRGALTVHGHAINFGIRMLSPKH